MDIIITATGKKVKTDLVTSIPAPATLYVRVLDMPLAEIAAVFGDPAETGCLTYAGQQLCGYTVLAALIPEGEAVRVNLRRG